MTKTNTNILKAVKRYDSKVKKKEVVFNPDKPNEAALLDAVDDDKRVNGVSFSVRVKEVLTAHYGLNDDNS